MGHKRGGKQNQRPKQIQPTVDDYDVKARLKRINRYGGKEFSSTQDIVQEIRSNISYDSSSQNNQGFLSDSFVTSKDLMQFSDKNNDAHNDLRRELEGKINSVKGELEHQLNVVKESRKWWLNILIPIITTIINCYVSINDKQLIIRINIFVHKFNCVAICQAIYNTTRS